jgi:hypothetical protein
MQTSYKTAALKGDSGMILVLVLVFTTAMMLLGSALLANAVSEKQIALYQAQDLRKQYLAEAGLEAGITVLMQDFYYSGELTGSLMDGSYRVTFENSGSDTRRIKSAATIESYTLELVLNVVLNPDGSLSIGEWKKL